jgi:hypothetical protein
MTGPLKTNPKLAASLSCEKPDEKNEYRETAFSCAELFRKTISETREIRIFFIIAF